MKNRVLIFGVLVAFVGALLPAAPAEAGGPCIGSPQPEAPFTAGGYTITELGTLGGSCLGPSAMNDLGTVVGISDTSTGTQDLFKWSQGTMTDLGPLGTFSPVAVNDSNEIAGTSGALPAIWQNGQIRTLPLLPGDSFASVQAINNTGVVVGESILASSVTHAVEWSNSSITDLGLGDNSSASAINDAGWITGSFQSPTTTGQTDAFVRSPLGVVTDLGVLPGDSVSEGVGINATGEVTGDSSFAKFQGNAFVWTPPGGPMINIGAPYNLPYSLATGIDDAGQIAGTAYDATFTQFVSFLWTPGIGFGDLCALTGCTGAYIADFNHKGQILLQATYGGSNSWWLLTPEASDSTPPVITTPAPITVNATSPTGATVSYVVTVTDPDNAPSELTLSCAPASGSNFVIGVTTVTCNASDPSGNTSAASFTVTVLGAAAQLNNLIAQAQTMDLQNGIATSLDAKLNAAIATIAGMNANSVSTACNELGAFVNDTVAQSGKQLTANQANELIAAAQQIQATLGC